MRDQITNGAQDVSNIGLIPMVVEQTSAASVPTIFTPASSRSA